MEITSREVISACEAFCDVRGKLSGPSSVLDNGSPRYLNPLHIYSYSEPREAPLDVKEQDGIGLQEFWYRL